MFNKIFEKTDIGFILQHMGKILKIAKSSFCFAFLHLIFHHHQSKWYLVVSWHFITRPFDFLVESCDCPLICVGSRWTDAISKLPFQCLEKLPACQWNISSSFHHQWIVVECLTLISTLCISPSLFLLTLISYFNFIILSAQLSLG